MVRLANWLHVAYAELFTFLATLSYSSWHNQILSVGLGFLILKFSCNYMWWRFSDTIDRAVDFAPRRIKVTKRFADKEQASRQNFYVETQFEKIHGEERENPLFSKGYNELGRVVLCLQSLRSVTCLMEVPVYKCLARCNQDADITNLRNSRICTLRFHHNRSNYALIVVSDPRCRL